MSPVDCTELDMAFDDLVSATESMKKALERMNGALGIDPSENRSLPESIRSKPCHEGSKISPVVLDILRRCTTKENLLFLPPESLDPRLYKAVNRAIELSGGQWSKAKKAHIFEGDALAQISKVIYNERAVFCEKTSAPKLCAAAKKKKNQTFYTPETVASFVAKLADVEGKSVLEPSAGQGALIRACMSGLGAFSVVAMEIDPDACEYLSLEFPWLVEVVQTDFLAKQPYRTFERIVMNPPFTQHQDIAHVAHALRWLAPGGVLVAIMSANTSRRGFQALIKGWDHDIFPLPANSFRESGTNTHTIVLRIRKGAA